MNARAYVGGGIGLVQGCHQVKENIVPPQIRKNGTQSHAVRKDGGDEQKDRHAGNQYAAEAVVFGFVPENKVKNGYRNKRKP